MPSVRTLGFFFKRGLSARSQDFPLPPQRTPLSPWLGSSESLSMSGKESSHLLNHALWVRAEDGVLCARNFHHMR
jgi:hypothetical protein